MKRNLILAALGVLAAHMSGLSLYAQDRAEPLPSVPATPLMAAAEGAKEPIPAPKVVAPAPVAAPGVMPGAPGVIHGAPVAGPVVYGNGEYGPSNGNPFYGNDCNKGYGLKAGAAAYYLKPHWQDGTLYTTQTITVDAANAVISIDNRATKIDMDYNFSPKVWVGWGDESGLGARLSYFRLDNTLDTAFVNPAAAGNTATLVGLPTIPADLLGNAIGFGGGTIVAPAGGLIGIGAGAGPDQISIDTRLLMNVWDLDLTQDIKCGCWNLTAGGGVRYARIEQTYNGRINTPFVAAGVNVLQSINMNNTFEGVGPQALLEAKRGLGDMGLGVYGSARAGILFGESRRAYNQAAIVQAGGATVLTITRSDQNVQDSTLPYIELEGGVEWSQNMGNYTPFVRVGVVGQNWFGAGSPSSTPTGSLGDLGLFGIQASAGVSY